MNRNVIRVWFTIHLALCIIMVYYAITQGSFGAYTKLLLIPVSLSTMFIGLYRTGIFKKGALRPDAEARNS